MQGPDAPTPIEAITPPRVVQRPWIASVRSFFRWLLPGMIATLLVTIVALTLLRYGVLRNTPQEGVYTPFPIVPATFLRSDFFTAENGMLSEQPMSGPADVYCLGWGWSLDSHPFLAGDPIPEWAMQPLIAGPKVQVWSDRVKIVRRAYGFPLPWLSWTTLHQPISGGEPYVRLTVGSVAIAPAQRTVSAFVLNELLTCYPDPPGFLLNTVIFSTLWMPITAWHRRRRAKRGGCKRCGYSREGLAQDSICPECGQKSVH